MDTRIVFFILAAGIAGPAAAAEPLAPAAIQVAQAVRPLVSGERVRVQKLVRDLESAMQSLNSGGVAPFQDPAYAEKWRQSAQRFRDALAKFPQVDDPDVQAAAAKLAEFDNMIAFGMTQAGAQQGELGDVQAILAGIERALRDNRAPAWLPPPFSPEEARAWLTLAAGAQKTAEASIAEMQRIAPTAYLPVNVGTVQDGAPYDSQDLDRLMRFADGILKDVDNAVQETAGTLRERFAAQDAELAYYRELDPDNEKHRMNAFLKEGSEAEIYAGLDRQIALAQSVVDYQRAFGKEPSAASTARVAEIANLRRTYAENRQRAMGASRLPEPKSSDTVRLAIAEQVLAAPSYEFGEHGPVVLTTPEIVEREQQVSEAEIKDVDIGLSGNITMSGTQTTWNYKWREFKFATALKEDGKDEWYIWWITAKNYSSGGDRTPLNQWVSGAATKGSLIPRENF